MISHKNSRDFSFLSLFDKIENVDFFDWDWDCFWKMITLLLLLLLLLIYTHYDIVLRWFMREMLYILQKEKSSKKRKTFLLWFNYYLDFWTTSEVITLTCSTIFNFFWRRFYTRELFLRNKRFFNRFFLQNSIIAKRWNSFSINN
jgi:ABC-type multidrug transport system fused ATPase/permease subunit